MLFTIKNAKKRYLTAYKIKTYARQVVLLSKKYSTEIKLDKYLKEHYKISLEYACLQIIKYAKYYITDKDEAVIILPDKKLNEIATIITYGNGPIKGSNLLRIAFQQK